MSPAHARPKCQRVTYHLHATVILQHVLVQPTAWHKPNTNSSLVFGEGFSRLLPAATGRTQPKVRELPSDGIYVFIVFSLLVVFSILVDGFLHQIVGKSQMFKDIISERNLDSIFPIRNLLLVLLAVRTSFFRKFCVS